MPSVNKFVTALVAGLAIGAQAGPCRPYVPPSSVIQSQLTTTEHAQSAARTSAAYTDAISKSETETEAKTEDTPYTTAVQVTSSTEAERKPTTTAAETATTTRYPVSESTSSAGAESTSTAKGDTSSLPSTTEQSSAALYTTTSAPSTTSLEPKTTLDTTTRVPTTTSKPTTTSQAATSTCPPMSKLTCNKTGSLNNDASNYLIQILYDLDLASCKEECKKHDNCKAIGVNTAEQCELYSAAASTLGFKASDTWYSVFDACCFEEDGETGN